MIKFNQRCDSQYIYNILNIILILFTIICYYRNLVNKYLKLQVSTTTKAKRTIIDKNDKSCDISNKEKDRQSQVVDQHSTKASSTSNVQWLIAKNNNDCNITKPKVNNINLSVVLTMFLIKI